ncbi:MAG TPA: hypothetical protein PKY16_11065, partial [Gemmiger qucibialis]|nr:hypothetical protein [Gemmiger qucibialis]
FWQRRCRAAAAGAVLKPQDGNCAVLPYLLRYESPDSSRAGSPDPAETLFNELLKMCGKRNA